MEKLRRFFREVIAEAKKISWPSRKELLTSFSVVLVILIVTGLYFFVLDFIFSGVVSAIFKALGIG
ncbi:MULTISPECIES: preprotein translocase subunit SecE [Thermotoga]|uniref:Protein translocase subunit SecE n=1 Tax=Thermotoga neapolitana (strain ATCC 49049 / DSM 4359 / NBRC 107923 / NS-E) TaxID=309803 RepID=B9KBK1_THENN|nr:MULTISPECIES: preprotein translocase subunit SecE [Thermotoga]ACM22397.1 Preprotein translocase subunit secE [Thermotoga neapolitana DSM 4359]AJG40355.1 preprotein translocase subunit SecE [Thermotoga sp. RQ7]KFZ22509.1 preprotein translocase subunit SecE [Thermotoga neapolitana LA10]HBF11212.1 preprotein translocase subunit SecE [Thermotoga neapolitana]